MSVFHRKRTISVAHMIYLNNNNYYMHKHARLYIRLAIEHCCVEDCTGIYLLNSLFKVNSQMVAI